MSYLAQADYSVQLDSSEFPVQAEKAGNLTGDAPHLEVLVVDSGFPGCTGFGILPDAGMRILIHGQQAFGKAVLERLMAGS